MKFDLGILCDLYLKIRSIYIIFFIVVCHWKIIESLWFLVLIVDTDKYYCAIDII